MLDSITDVFLSDNGTKKVNIPYEVTKLISFEKLRLQFIELFKGEGLRTLLFEHIDNWKGVGGKIIKEIIDKPVKFPEYKKVQNNKTALKIYQSMQRKAGHRPMLLATKLWLSDSEEGKEGQVYWLVETHPQVRICGRLLFIDNLEDFPLSAKP